MASIDARRRAIEPPMPTWAAQLFESQDLLIKEVRALRAQLTPRAGGSRDGDATVARALAELGLKQFVSCHEVIALASTDTALRLALAAALIDDALQLGHCFSRLYRRGLIDREMKSDRHGL